MDYRSLHLKTVADLRRIAREEGVKVPAGTTKAVLVELILEKQRASAEAKAATAPQSAAPAQEAQPAQGETSREKAPARRRGATKKAPAADADAKAGGDAVPAEKAAQASGDQTEAPREKAPARRRGATKKAPAADADAKTAGDAVPAGKAGKATGAQTDAPGAKATPRRRPAAKAKTPENAAGPELSVVPSAAAENEIQVKKQSADAIVAHVATPQPLAAEMEAKGSPEGADATGARTPAQGTDAPVGEKREEVRGADAPASRRSAQRAEAPEGAPEAKKGGLSLRTEPGGAVQRAEARNASPQTGVEQTEAPLPEGAAALQSAAPAETLSEPKSASEAPPRPAYQRPLSTQQRMGARTQPVPGAYRTQSRNAAPARFNSETMQPRSRSFDNPSGYRRPPSGEGAPARTGYRRAGEDMPQGAYRRAPGPEAAQSEAGAEPPRPTAENAGVRRPLAGEEVLPGPSESLNAGVPELLSSGDCGDGAGILEIHPDGYGFLRAENYLPGNRDVYVSAAQIRRFNLHTGDYVVGKTRAQQMGDRSVGLIYINEVNGQTPDMARHRRPFDSLVPVYPNERLRMERGESNDISLRLIDMIAPIGKGQRGMIVSQPKAGKTTLLKKIANAITSNNPDVHLIVLLIDERPEEVTDMKRSIEGEVVYSTFDEAPENHTRVSEMVLERAQRLVELGKDVVVLLDSITRLARAYNLVIPPTGRSLSGGLDPGALFRPKRFFGAARNIENGGSLTIIATALVDTGSRMDDIIFEEFKGTGNMELHLDRSLSDRRIFPAIDLYRSGTRREELLLTKEELDGVYQVRRMLSKGSPQEAAEQLISLMEKTRTNLEFFQKLKGWLNVCEKDGFTMR